MSSEPVRAPGPIGSRRLVSPRPGNHRSVSPVTRSGNRDAMPGHGGSGTTATTSAQATCGGESASRARRPPSSGADVPPRTARAGPRRAAGLPDGTSGASLPDVPLAILATRPDPTRPDPTRVALADLSRPRPPPCSLPPARDTSVMFESLAEPKPDAILGLMAAFRGDTRDDKLDLGVGVYKDAAGATPVMQAVQDAERHLLETQTTKAYVGPTGSASFCAAMIRQVFGADLADGPLGARVRAVQAVGGSGALRVLADLMREARPQASLWLSDPSWPNHRPLLGAAGFEIRTYPYYDATTGRVDIESMLAALGEAATGDIVVLHGCCHNPTGADLSIEQWRRVVDALQRGSLFPMIDLAYQGFGDGLEEDAAAVRLMASEMDELVVAASCSKNLGLYRERVGAALLLARTESEATRAHGRLGGVIRANYSMPPDHGANATERVLTDAALNGRWREELESMRRRMVGLRRDFAEAMRLRSNSSRFDYIAEQKGHVQPPAARRGADRAFARGARHLHRRRRAHQRRGSARGGHGAAGRRHLQRRRRRAGARLSAPVEGGRGVGPKDPAERSGRAVWSGRVRPLRALELAPSARRPHDTPAEAVLARARARARADRRHVRRSRAADRRLARAGAERQRARRRIDSLGARRRLIAPAARRSSAGRRPRPASRRRRRVAACRRS